MILMSKYKGQHGGKRVKKFGQGSPPPFFGQCPKENIFSLRRASLTCNSAKQFLQFTTYMWEGRLVWSFYIVLLLLSRYTIVGLKGYIWPGFDNTYLVYLYCVIVAKVGMKGYIWPYIWSIEYLCWQMLFATTQVVTRTQTLAYAHIVAGQWHWVQCVVPVRDKANDRSRRQVFLIPISRYFQKNLLLSTQIRFRGDRVLCPRVFHPQCK